MFIKVYAICKRFYNFLQTNNYLNYSLMSLFCKFFLFNKKKHSELNY